MKKKYKINVDENHPAGTVIFVIPERSCKEKRANADDCFIWSHAQFEASGLDDGEVFDINMETGLPWVDLSSIYDEALVDLLWEVKEGKTHPNFALKKIHQAEKLDMKKFLYFLKAEGIVIEEEHKPQDFNFLFDVWNGTNPDGLL